MTRFLLAAALTAGALAGVPANACTLSTCPGTSLVCRTDRCLPTDPPSVYCLLNHDGEFCQPPPL